MSHTQVVMALPLELTPPLPISIYRPSLRRLLVDLLLLSVGRFLSLSLRRSLTILLSLCLLLSLSLRLSLCLSLCLSLGLSLSLSLGGRR